MTRVRPVRIISTTLLLMTTLLSGSSLATPTEADRETARSLMDQADAQVEAKNYTKALSLYQAAHDLMGVPTTGLEVAKAQVALGLLVEARNTALSVTRIVVQPNEPRVFAEARREAQKLADALSVRIASVQVKVLGVVNDATLSVQVDGASVPPSAALLPRKVNPGKHHIVVTARGYRAAAYDVDVAEGKVADVTVTLEPELGAAQPAATAALAGAPRALSGSTEPAALPQQRRGLPTLSYIGLGVGAAGIVTGSITGLLTFSKKSSIKNTYCDGTNECTTGARGDIDSGHTLATVSNVAFGVGVVGVGVGIAAWLAAPREKPPATTTAARNEHQVKLVPVIGTNAVGVVGWF